MDFLLIISLFLNILALFFIVLLFQRQNRLSSLEEDKKKALEEMEDIISTFIVEIKEENERFFEKLKDVKHNKHKTDAVEGKKENGLSSNNAKNTKKHPNPQQNHTKEYIIDTRIGVPESGEDVQELLNLIHPSKEEKKEKSLLEQAIDLKKQGKSVEEIAKLLNKGKTEIELLLKFRQNT